MANKPEGNVKDEKYKTLSLGECLGQGAFGAVHVAQIKETGEIVAVKQVKGQHTEKAALQRTSLLQEVELLKTLDHPHIVKYLGVLDGEDETSLILEYMSGGSVATQLNKFGPFTEAVCEKYTTHILMGLQYLHSKNVIHRDIKCANILLDGNAVAKLADFGISEHIESIVTPMYTGTITYMAPELLAEKPCMNKKPADIWSMGCALVEMLTGDLPWRVRGSKEDVRKRILNFKFDKEILPFLPKNVTKNVKEFLSKCFLSEELRCNADELLQHEFCKKHRVNYCTRPLAVRELINDLSNTSLNKHQELETVNITLDKIAKIKESTSTQDIYNILSCLYLEWIDPSKLKSLMEHIDIIPHQRVLKLLIQEALQYQILTGISSPPKNKNIIARPKQRRQFLALVGGSREDDKKLFYRECEVFTITGDQTVFKIPDLPVKCTANTVISDENGVLYKVGGQISEDGMLYSSMLKYDVEDGCWLPLCPMQLPRSRHVAVFVRGYIVVFGGTLNPTSFEIFNTKDSTWQRKDNFPFLLLQAAGCECDGDVFASGGFTIKNDDNYLYKGILRYHLKNDSWSIVGHMRRHRQQHVMAAVNHKIYIAGGIDTTTSAEMFDPATHQSMPLSKMPYGCFNTRMVSFEHFLITLSLDGKNPEEKHVVIYNTETSKWSFFNITLPRKYDVAHLSLVRL